jgi:hypothetical protein
VGEAVVVAEAMEAVVGLARLPECPRVAECLPVALVLRLDPFKERRCRPLREVPSGDSPGRSRPWDRPTRYSDSEEEEAAGVGMAGAGMAGIAGPTILPTLRILSIRASGRRPLRKKTRR